MGEITSGGDRSGQEVGRNRSEVSTNDRLKRRRQVSAQEAGHTQQVSTMRACRGESLSGRRTNSLNHAVRSVNSRRGASTTSPSAPTSLPPSLYPSVRQCIHHRLPPRRTHGQTDAFHFGIPPNYPTWGNKKNINGYKKKSESSLE